MRNIARYKLAACFLSLVSVSSLATQTFRCPQATSIKFENHLAYGTDALSHASFRGSLPNSSSEGERGIENLDFKLMQITNLYKIRLYKSDNSYYVDCHYGIKTPELSFETEVYLQHPEQRMVYSTQCSINGQEADLGKPLVLGCEKPEDCEIICE